MLTHEQIRKAARLMQQVGEPEDQNKSIFSSPRGLFDQISGETEGGRKVRINLIFEVSPEGDVLLIKQK